MAQIQKFVYKLFVNKFFCKQICKQSGSIDFVTYFTIVYKVYKFFLYNKEKESKRERKKESRKTVRQKRENKESFLCNRYAIASTVEKE